MARQPKRKRKASFSGRQFDYRLRAVRQLYRLMAGRVSASILQTAVYESEDRIKNECRGSAKWTFGNHAIRMKFVRRVSPSVSVFKLDLRLPILPRSTYSSSGLK